MFSERFTNYSFKVSYTMKVGCLMKKKTIIVSILCIFIPVFFYISCFHQTSTTNNKDLKLNNENKKIRIGLILNTSTNPLYEQIERGARLAEVAFDIDLIVRTGTKETSVTQQIDILESMVEHNYDAIVLNPIGPEVAATIQKAIENNVHIVLINNNFSEDTMNRYSLYDVITVAIDDTQCASQCAELLISTIIEPCNALILQGKKNANNTKERTRAALDTFRRTKNVKEVFVETANWSIDEAYEISKRVFTNNHQIQVVFVENDMMTLGLLHYLNENQIESVEVVSIDAIDPAKELVNSNDLFATVDINASDMGFEGIRSAYLLCKQKTDVTSKIITYRFVTSSDFNK